MSGFLSVLFTSLIQLIAFCIIPFIWWLLSARKTNFFQWIGLKKPVFKDSIYKIIGIIIIVAGLYIGAMFLFMTTLLRDVPTATSQFGGKGLSAIPSIIIYAGIQTSLSEELFFRGFLCKRLSDHSGFVKGNIIQSVFFGLLHGIPFGMATGKWYVYILLTLLPASIGFIQGWLNEKKADGSIIPSWILHALMNVLSALSAV
ncbi:MAG: CPBP family intramembrane metalloprotease [Oscillospiraceae bacterium]|nr:CPBP family intramembrane metalloprotease [Oscillospiraceae bacterium]